MTPQDAVGRAKMRSWMRYIEEVPTVAVRVPSFANLFAPMRYSEYSDKKFSDHAERLPLRKRFYQRMTKEGFGADDVNYAKGQIRQTCERIDQAIAINGGPWIMGDDLTQADVSVVCFWDFIKKHRPKSAPEINCPQIEKISEMANLKPEFSATSPDK